MLSVTSYKSACTVQISFGIVLMYKKRKQKMAIKETVDKALQTEMSRRQFLAQVGGVFLALVGVSSIMQALHRIGDQDRGMQSSMRGYGSSPYGG